MVGKAGHDGVMTKATSELAHFREVQRLAFRCALAIEAELHEGMSERVVTRMMQRWLADHGVRECFHVPFAWFGDRTSFAPPWGTRSFAPTQRRLEAGMPIILDLAPSLDGYAAAVAHATCLGENLVWSKLQNDLRLHRELILELVKERKSAREIYRAVDALTERQGYENRHKVYPGAQLAYRMERLPPTRLRRVVAFGVALPAWHRLSSDAQAARFMGRPERWPYWDDSEASEVPITPGLWVVEPHLARGVVGAKWQELLVVTRDDAFWLDDDVPHVQRWSRPRA
jgi:hypothetical protein